MIRNIIYENQKVWYIAPVIIEITTVCINKVKPIDRGCLIIVNNNGVRMDKDIIRINIQEIVY